MKALTVPSRGHFSQRRQPHVLLVKTRHCLDQLDKLLGIRVLEATLELGKEVPEIHALWWNGIVNFLGGRILTSL